MWVLLPGECLPPLVGFVKLNFDIDVFRQLGEVRNWKLIIDHHGRVFRAFFKLVGRSLAIEARNCIGQSYGFLQFSSGRRFYCFFFFFFFDK